MFSRSAETTADDKSCENKTGNEAELQHKYDKDCNLVKDADNESAVFQVDISMTVKYQKCCDWTIG